MKLSAAFSYRLKYQMKSLGFFFGYFFLFAIVFPLIGILFAGVNTQVNSDVLFASFVFIFIIALFGVSSDFKLFIQNGMSRQNIFLSYLISNVTISALMASILIIFKMIANDFLTHNFKITLFLSDLYGSDNSWISFIFLFLFFMFGASLASVVGTFNDRVTGYKKMLVLATLVIIPVIFGLLLQLGGHVFRLNVLTFFKNILGINSTGYHIVPVSITLTTLIVFLSIITYLMNYKREIRRVND